MTRSGGRRGVPSRGLLAAGVAVLALSAGLACPAGAATRFVATTGNDAANTCLASGSPCKTITHTLSQVVANDTISVAAGTYNLALGETFPLTINQNMTLTGAGAGSTILDATAANTRVITVDSGPTAAISGVTITGGHVSCNGACQARGGGLNNSGTLTLTNSTLSGNTATCTNSGSGECSAHAGLSSGSASTLTLTNSTLSGNTATCTNSGSGSCSANGGLRASGTLTNSTLSGNTVSCTNSGSGQCSAGGGGIANTGSGGTLTVTNSTVSGNTASCTNSGSGSCTTGGGGILNTTTLAVLNATVTANTVTCSGAGCTALGGGLLNFAGTTTLQNTIVAKQLAGADCGILGGTITSLGFNLDSNNTCQFTQPSDKPNVSNPLLVPLANNGGPTQTHALLPGSPAIDAVTSGCPPPTTDQRGVARPQGTACDIGAYEVVVVDPAAVSAFVTRLYQTVLGREPDPPGLAAFIDQIQQFGTVIPTVLAFFKSEEFLDRHLDDVQFLTVLYRTFLNREPDPDGLAAFLGLLASGCRTRDTLIAALSFSGEFRALVPPVPVSDPRIPFLAEIFAWTLNRPPDPGGFASFLAQLQRSTAVSTITGFLHSQEFTVPRKPAGEYVSALYLVFLGRPPDCDGLFSFVGTLTPDTDPQRDQLAAQFAGSGEFQAILDQVFP